MTDRMTLSAFLGDFVVYRNLIPMDKRLPDLQAVQRAMGRNPTTIPRKTTPAYAEIVSHILKAAQNLRYPDKPIRRLLYIGDTLMNDGTALRNFRAYWPVLGFIGNEKLNEARRVEIVDDVMSANRWDALTDFVAWLEERGYPLDAETTAVIDIDKTAIGARGRNDKAIDQARIAGVRRTVAEVLGDSFREDRFRVIYDELNQQKYHYFTTDNQDYLAYVSLMLSAGVYDYDRLLEDLKQQRVTDFNAFVALCRDRVPSSGGLAVVHQEVQHNLAQGDPTPFKSFRYQEYLMTIARMDSLPAETPPEQLLREEILITREVVDVAFLLKERGVLLFGISDKPDEASVPSAELAAQGYRAIHQTLMKMSK